MDYERRNIMINKKLNTRLKHEGNASFTISQALTLYYESKDTVKKLIELVEAFEGSFTYLNEYLQPIEQIKQDVAFIKERANR